MPAPSRPPTQPDSTGPARNGALSAAAGAAAAAGASAVGGNAIGAGADLAYLALGPGAARAAGEAIETALETFYAKRFVEARYELLRKLGTAFPDAAPADVARAVDDESALERAFQEKSRARWQRDVPPILALAPAERERAMRAFLARERNIAAMRERALLSRAASRLEHASVRLTSPLGAYWTLDPKLKTHTLDCVAMAGKFWPWQVVDRVHPPMHANCGCRLWGLDEAVAKGWMTRDQVPDEGDAVRRANQLARRVPELREKFLAEGVAEPVAVAIALEADRWMDLAEAAEPLRYPKGFSKGGQFRPRHGYDPGDAVRRALRDLGRPPHRVGDRRGEWRRVEGRRVFVPERAEWRRTIAGKHFVSPAQSTEVYPAAPTAESPGVPDSVRRAARELRDEVNRRDLGEMRAREARGETPVQAGDKRSRLALLAALGYRRTTRTTGTPRIDSFRNDATGQTLVVDFTRQGVRSAERVAAPPAPSRSLDHAPTSWDEFRQDVLGYAGELAERHHAANGATDFVESPHIGDIGGQRTWDGTTIVGSETRDVLEHTYAARAKGPLSDADAAEAYIATQVPLHEISHAVNPEDEVGFQRPERQWLDEALVEELSRQETAERLARQGQDDVLSWMARNPDHPYLDGNYRGPRLALSHLLDRAGVAPEDRRAYLERLKYETAPGERIPTLARDAAARNGTSVEAETQLAEGLLSDPAAHAPTPWYALPTLPKAAADRRETPTGLAVGGRRLAPGSTVTVEGGPHGTVTGVWRDPDGSYSVAVGDAYVRGVRPGEGAPGLTVDDVPRAAGTTEGDPVTWTRPDGRETEGTVDRVLSPGERGWAVEATTADGARVVVTDANTSGLRLRAPAPDRAVRDGVEGRHLFVEGKGWHFVPEGSEWSLDHAGHSYTSPEGTTDVYRDGELVSRKGRRPTVPELIPPSKRGKRPAKTGKGPEATHEGPAAGPDAATVPEATPEALRAHSGTAIKEALEGRGWAYRGLDRTTGQRIDEAPPGTYAQTYVSPDGRREIAVHWWPSDSIYNDAPRDVTEGPVPEVDPVAARVARNALHGDAEKWLESKGFVGQTHSGEWMTYTNPDLAASVLLRGDPDADGGPPLAAIAVPAPEKDVRDADNVLWRLRPETRVRFEQDMQEVVDRLREPNNPGRGWRLGPAKYTDPETGKLMVLPVGAGGGRAMAPFEAGGPDDPHPGTHIDRLPGFDGVQDFTRQVGSGDGAYALTFRVRWTREPDGSRKVLDAGYADLGGYAPKDSYVTSGLITRDEYVRRAEAVTKKAQQDRADALLARRTRMSDRIAAGEPPLRVGDVFDQSDLAAVGAVVSSSVRRRGTATVTLRFRGTGGMQRVQYTNAGGGIFGFGGDSRWKVTRLMAHDKGNVGLARKRLDRTPHTDEELRQDALGRADEMGAHYGAEVSATDVSFGGTGRGAAGVHRWDGSIAIDNRSRDALRGAMKADAEGRPLTDDQKAAFYDAMETLQHEVNHGVNPHSQDEYQGLGIALEEGLTEELAHVLLDGWLHSMGRDDVREWARDHPGHRYVQGTYQGYREFIRGALDHGGVPDERRGPLLEHMKFRQDNEHRIATLAELIAREQNRGAVHPVSAVDAAGDTDLAVWQSGGEVALPWGESLSRTREGLAIAQELKRQMAPDTPLSKLGTGSDASFVPILRTDRPDIGAEAAPIGQDADGNPIRPGDVVARTTQVSNPDWSTVPGAPMHEDALVVGRAGHGLGGGMSLNYFGTESYGNAGSEFLGGDKVVDLLRPREGEHGYEIRYGDQVSIPASASIRRDANYDFVSSVIPKRMVGRVSGRVVGYSTDGTRALVQGVARPPSWDNEGNRTGARAAHFEELVPLSDVLPEHEAPAGYVRLGDGKWVQAGTRVLWDAANVGPEGKTVSLPVTVWGYSPDGHVLMEQGGSSYGHPDLERLARSGAVKASELRDGSASGASLRAPLSPGRPEDLPGLLERAPEITMGDVRQGVPGLAYDESLHGEGVAGRAGLRGGPITLGPGAFDANARLNTYLLAHEVGHRLVQPIVADGYPPELLAFAQGHGRAEGRYGGAGNSDLFGPDRKRPEEFLADAYADLLHGRGEFRYVPGVDGPDDPEERRKARLAFENSPETKLLRLVAGAARAEGLPDRPLYASEPADPAAHARGDYSSGYRTVRVVSPESTAVLDGTGLEVRRALAALPADAHLWTFHATDPATAAAMAEHGIDPEGKPGNLARDRYEAGDYAEYAPGRGLGSGLYVGARPADVGGYGRALVAVRVRKRDLAVPPEQASLGETDPGNALSVGDGMVSKAVPASDVRLLETDPKRDVGVQQDAILAQLRPAALPTAHGAAPDERLARSTGRPGADAATLFPDGAPPLRPEFLERVRGNLDPRGDTASGYGTLASKFAASHDMTPAEYDAAVEARLRELVDGSDLVVRLDPRDLPTFLDGGHLMNQHEAGSSHGNFDPEWRASLESETWAIHGAPRPRPESPGERAGSFHAGGRSLRAQNYAAKHPELYPVYGYLSDPAQDPPGARGGDHPQGQYGQAKIVLRPEAKARSYAYFSDSLGDVSDGRGAPSPMAAPSVLSVPRGDPLAWTTLGPVAFDFAARDRRREGPVPYAEAQVFGGVRPGDVQRVELADPPTPEQRAALDKAGVPWSVPSDEAYADLRQHILDGLERGEEPDAAYGEIDGPISDDQRAELERMIDEWKDAHAPATAEERRRAFSDASYAVASMRSAGAPYSEAVSELGDRAITDAEREALLRGYPGAEDHVRVAASPGRPHRTPDFDTCQQRSLDWVAAHPADRVVQLAGYRGDMSAADERWRSLPPEAVHHYVVLHPDGGVTDLAPRQFGADADRVETTLADLRRDWSAAYPLPRGDEPVAPPLWTGATAHSPGRPTGRPDPSTPRPGVAFHLAPTAARADILERGLQPSGETMMGAPDGAAPRVYLHADAHSVMEHRGWATEAPHDVWRVDTEGLDLHRDYPGAFPYAEAAVPPERLTLALPAEDRVSWKYDRNELYPHSPGRPLPPAGDDTPQQRAALRQNPAARKARALFPRGTRVEATAGAGGEGNGRLGTVVRHVPATNAQGGHLSVLWDSSGEVARVSPGSVRRAEQTAQSPGRPGTGPAWAAAFDRFGTDLPLGTRVRIGTPEDADLERASAASRLHPSLHGREATVVPGGGPSLVGVRLDDGLRASLPARSMSVAARPPGLPDVPDDEYRRIVEASGAEHAPPTPQEALLAALRVWRGAFHQSIAMRKQIAGEPQAPAYRDDPSMRLWAGVLDAALDRAGPLDREWWRIVPGSGHPPEVGSEVDLHTAAVGLARDQVEEYGREFAALGSSSTPTVYRLPRSTRGVMFPDGAEAVVRGRFRVASVEHDDARDVDVATLEPEATAQGPGRPNPKLKGLREVGAAEFAAALRDAYESTRHGRWLTPHTEAELAGARMFLANDGLTGGALIPTADGRLEAASLFNRRDLGAPAGAGTEMMRHQTAEGADYLSATGDKLRTLYESLGWEVESRTEWDDAHAPEGWDYARDGRPPIYEMRPKVR